MTRSQVRRLGVRLVSSTSPAAIDLEALHELLVVYSDMLAGAVSVVHAGVGVVPTSRIKSTGSIMERLDHHGGSRLSTIQDLAGMRIVGAFDRDARDWVVGRLIVLFEGRRRPRVVDRRDQPVAGGAAVHVIVFPEGFPVEIQVRTRLQHEWADLLEKLADRVGRGVRYGQPADQRRSDAQRSRLSANERKVDIAEQRLIDGTVRLVMSIGEQIRLHEFRIQLHPDDEAVEKSRVRLETDLVDLRSRIGVMDTVRESTWVWKLR
jgi:hypothetical protein